MESSGRRSHRDQGRKDRHLEYLQKQEDLNQPKFGNLIPRSSSHNPDDLRQFAKNVLGDYHSTMQTIQGDYGGQQMSKLFGVERTHPITPITSTSAFNIFESNMKERMNTTLEKREPVLPAEGRPSFPTFGNRHKSNHKGTKESSLITQSSFKNPDRTNKTTSRNKVHPYVKSNHPLMTGVSSSSNESPSTTTAIDQNQCGTKNSKKHKKSRINQSLTKTQHDSSRPIHPLDRSMAVSPSHSEKGSLNLTSRTSLKRSNSLDNPVQTGHTSFSCYNPTTSTVSTVEKKKEKKQKRTKGQRDQIIGKQKNLTQDSHMIVGHMTYPPGHMTSVTTLDGRDQPSKPSKLNFDSLASIEESTSDTADLQSMLKEMNSEIATLPSFLTPIHTPGLKQESPFVFAVSQMNKNAINEENSLGENPLLRSTHVTPFLVPSTASSQLLSTDEIIGTISSSDSSDSSDDSDTSSDEDDDKNDIQRINSKAAGVPPLTIIKEESKLTTEENTSFMLDQINKQFNSPLNTLTPIKSSPLFPSLPFPLNDESANMSPAKLTRPITTTTSITNTKGSNETSLGFLTLPSKPNLDLSRPDIQAPSETDSSSSEEESDTESSESEDEAFSSNKPLPASVGAQNLYPGFVEAHPSSIRQESRPFQFEYEEVSQDNTVSDIQSTNIGKLISSHDLTRKFDQNDNISLNKDSNNVIMPSKEHKNPVPSVNEITMTDEDDTPLWVKIPLWKVSSEIQQKTPKPQATVEPYCVSNRKRTSSSADSSSELPLSRREHSDIHHERFSTSGEDPDDPYNADHRHHHGDSGRSHSNRRGWPSEYHEGRPPRRRGENERGNRRGERYDRYIRSSSPPHHGGSRDEYWGDYRTTSSSGYDSRRDSANRRQYSDRSHGNSSEYYYERARSLKREADAITGHGAARAIKYMQSVSFFMRHGFAQENEVKWDGVHTSGINKAFKIYSDTINLLKYSMKLGSDCKPLLVNCLRCHGVLLWKMYTLKQRTVVQYHKELQEVFNSSKISQKSPNPSAASFSPLPSPASVGSTNSSCSGAGGIGSASSIQDQNMPLSKTVCNKVNEYLTLTGYVHQSIDLWKQADSMSEQYRDIFSIVDRRIGHVTQFSPVAQIADWIDESLQAISSKWS